MKFKKILLLLNSFVVLLLCFGCAAKRSAQTSEKTEKVEIHTQQRENATESQKTEISLNIQDTTKKRSAEVFIITGEQIAETLNDSGKVTDRKKTTFNKTTLYISEEDLYLFTHGQLKDSSEIKDNIILDQDIESKNKERHTERKKTDGSKYVLYWCLLIILIVIFVIWRIYKKLK